MEYICRNKNEKYGDDYSDQNGIDKFYEIGPFITGFFGDYMNFPF
jgi:hypothetical protein